MAHRGKFYPKNQSLRLYYADDNWNFDIPSVSKMSFGALTDGINAPVDGDYLFGQVTGFTPGDWFVECRSSPIVYHGVAVEFGWQIEIDAATFLRKRWCQFWADGVEQLERENPTTTNNDWQTVALFTPAAHAVPGRVLWVNNFILQQPKTWAEF